MAETKSTYLVPILSRPPPLEFTMAPVDDQQPSILAKCGHTVWRREHLVIAGAPLREGKPKFSERIAKLPAWLQRFSAPKQCSTCKFGDGLKAAILCAYCQEVIFSEEPVSTYFPKGKLPEGFEARATRTRNGFVGCMRMDCCPTGGFFAGHWHPDGIVSPFSTGVAVSEVFASGQAIFTNIQSPR